MYYTAHTWADTGVAPDGRFTAARGNEMEQGIVDAHTRMDAATVSGTSATLALINGGDAIETTNAAAVTITVPPNSSVAFPIGTVMEVHQIGAGQVTIAPGAGVTLRSRGGALKIAGQYGVLSMRKRATDEWLITGDTTT